MNNVLRLIKNYFQNFINKIFKNTKKKKTTISMVIIIGVIGLIFSIVFSMMSYYNIMIVKDNNPEIAIFSFSTTALMFSLMLIATEGSVGIKSTDDEMLLSLPISKSQIIIAKVIYYFIFDFIVILLLLFPSYIIYGIIVDNATIGLVFRGFVVVFLIALFANGMAGIINTLFARISKKFKYSGVLQSILNLLLVVIFIVIYIGFTLLSQNQNTSLKLYDLYFVKLLSNFVIYNNIFNLIQIMLFSLIPFSLSVFFKTFYFNKNASVYHTNKTDLIYKESSVSKSLFKREIGKYFSIPIYVINTAIGFVMAVAFSIIIVMVGKDSFLANIKLIIASGYQNEMIPVSIEKVIDGYFDYILIMILFFVNSMTSITSCSISLEGKSLWILKAHPVFAKDVFKSKIKVQMVISIIPSIISALLFGIAIGMKYFIFIIMILILIQLIIAINGLVANLLFPKLSWESEVEPIKQGISVIFTLILNFILIIIPAIIYFFIENISVIGYLFVLLLIYLVIAIFDWLFLFTKGKKMFNEL